MSWTLSKVVVENLGGIRGRRSFELRSGINYIRGASASGKTSLTRAIVWGLTGVWGLRGDYQVKMGEDADFDVLLNRGSVNGFVELTIKKQNKVLVIRREISRRDGRCRLGECILREVSDGRERVTQGFEEVNNKLKEELGIPYPDLAYYVMFNGERDLLLTALPEGATLGRYLAACFGVTKYEKAWSYLAEVERDLRCEYEDYRNKAEDRREAKVLLEDRERRVKELEAERRKKIVELEDIRSKLKAIEDRIRELDNLYAQILSTERDIEEKSKMVSKILSLIDARNRDIEREQLNIKEREEELLKIKSELKQCRQSLEEVNQNIRSLKEEYSSVSTEVDLVKQKMEEVETQVRLVEELHKRRERLSEIKSQIKNLESELADVREKHRKHSEQLREAEERLGRKKAALMAIENVFGWIEESPTACPVCDRPWDDELKTMSLERLRPKREKYETDVRELRDRVENLKGIVSSLEERIEVIERQVSRLEWEEESCKRELSELERRAPTKTLEELNRELSYLNREIEIKLERLRKLEADLADISLRKEELQGRIRDLERDKAGMEREIEHSRRSIERYISEVKKLEDQVEPIRREVENLKHRLEDLKAEYDEVRHQSLVDEQNNLRMKESAVSAELSRIEDELTRYRKEIEEVRERAAEYEMFKEEERKYREAVRVIRLTRDVIKAVSEALKEEMRSVVSEDVLSFLHDLGFESVEDVRLNERYRLTVRMNGLELDLETLCEGIRNAIGMGMKLSAAKFLNNMPNLICLDGCLRLDPGRTKALVDVLRRMGVDNILITEREVIPEITVT